MESLNRKPSEEVYEIAFSGSFIPEKYTPIWFFRNKLLGENESDKADIHEVEEGEKSFFSTEFLQFYIDKEEFRIRTKQPLSFDLVKDMAASVATKLEDSIKNGYSLNVRFHFHFKKEIDLLNTLNKASISQNLLWSSILNNPKTTVVRIIDDVEENKEISGKREITMFPCGRNDMKNNLHVFVSTFVKGKKNTQNSLSTMIDNDTESLKDSILIVNGIIDAFF